MAEELIFYHPVIALWKESYIMFNTVSVDERLNPGIHFETENEYDPKYKKHAFGQQ